MPAPSNSTAMTLDGPRLQARRGNGRWAASAQLDAGLQFRLIVPVSELRITFALRRDGVTPPALRRVLHIARPLRPSLFPVTLWLSEQGGFFSLNGLEPISAYQLVVELLEVRIGGLWLKWQDPAPPLKNLAPMALDEESLLPIPAGSPGGKQELTLPIPAGAPRIVRLRFRVTRKDNAAGEEEMQFRVLGSATDQDAWQSLEGSGPMAARVRPARGKWRDYTVFVSTRPAGGELRIIVKLGRNFRLLEVAVSMTEASAISWMHGIVWNYAVSPLAGGWKRVASNAAKVEQQAWWQTDWTRVANPVNLTRTHGLALAAPGNNGTVSWRFENLFVRPVPGGCYTYRSRLLRVIARLRIPGGGGQVLPSFFLSTCGFLNSCTPLPPLPVGEDEFEFVFFVAPQHNLAGVPPAELTVDFSFTRAGENAPVPILLEELRTEELLIGALPEGEGYASYQDNWPQISIPTPVGTVRTVHPNAPTCPVNGEPAPAPFLVNDHGWALAGGRWHLYGIYESGVAIKPMPPGPRPDITIWDTIGSTSYFVSGLAHTTACQPGALVSGQQGTALLNYRRPQPADDPNREMMVPGGPGEAWNVWAPTIINWQGAWWMYYNSTWGTDVWLAKSTDPELRVASWQYVNRDGTAPGSGTRTQVIPSSASVQGRDFTIVRSLDGQGNQVFHAYWDGGNPIRVYHMEAASPLAFDYTTATVVYDLIDSDTGRPDVDSESVYIVHDSNTEIFYLTVSKDGNISPGWQYATLIYLDFKERAILAGCPVSGDRSVVLSNANKLSPDQPSFIAPRDFCSADIIGQIGIAVGLGDNGMSYRANAMVLDMGNGSGGRLLEVALRLNTRRVYTGPERGAGPVIRTAGRVVRASFPDPNSNVERLAYFVTDRGDISGQDGSVLLVDGGEQQKVRNNFAGQFGLWIREGSGDRRFLLQGLGDPTSLIFDTGFNAAGQRFLYVACRNQGQIVRTDIAQYPTVPLPAPTVFTSGLTNPTDLADGGDRVYVLESAGAQSRIKWFMKDGSQSGTVPDDPSIPYIAPSGLQFLYGFLQSGTTLLVPDAGTANGDGRLLAVNATTGAKQLVASPSKGHGPFGIPVQVNLGNMYDELPSIVKVYWSADPKQFTADRYFTSIPHHAAEWTCDTTQPNHPWYFSYTQFHRELPPDRTEWLKFFGWGVQEIVWTPDIAVPVGQ
jgi:hypothetical protein